MFFSSNQNNNNNHRINYCNWKRIFITLLFLNTFLGCIYFVNEQKKQEIILNSKSTLAWNKIFYQQQEEYNQSSIKTYNAIEFIKKILSNEYNHDDLNRFYVHVKNEYSLGLKCTRKSNLTNDIKNNVISTNIENSSSWNSHRIYLNKYLIDHSNVCLNKTIDLLIIIMSKSDNYQTRDAIRRTWASKKTLEHYSSINIKYFFLIDFDEKLSESIQLENNLFHDIIQVQLPQQYTLVTYRVISIFEWSFRFCRTAKYLFKSDDDIFFNFILLLKFISPLIEQQQQQSIENSFLISDMKIYGYEHVNPHVFRHANGDVLARYIITYDEYPCEKYPTFLSGYGYLISKKARDAILYTAYQDPEPFRISDVYLTGIIPEYLSLPRQSMSDYIISDSKCEKFFNYSTAFACAGETHHGIKTDIFRNYNHYWQMIQKKH